MLLVHWCLALTLSLSQLASLVEATIEALEPLERFKQLCISEHETKLEHDKHLGLELEDQLHEKYLDLMDARMALGADLGYHSCPSELVEHHDQHHEHHHRHRERVMKAFDNKCIHEARSALMCSALQESRQTCSDPTRANELLERERFFCHEQELALASKRKYAAKHDIKQPCGGDHLEQHLRAAAREVQQLLDSMMGPDGCALSTHTSKRPHSLRSKICNMFTGCLGGKSPVRK